jgi:hypothetical protein
VPPDVAARLDATLASLRAGLAGPGAADDPTAAVEADAPAPGETDPARPGDPTGDAGATVVPLPRRRWPAALLAAAAVVAIGFGVTQVLPTGGDDAGDSAGSAAESGQDDGRTALSDDGAMDRPRPASDELVLELQEAGVDRLESLDLLGPTATGAAPQADAETPEESADQGVEREAGSDARLVERLAPALRDCGPRPRVQGSRELVATYRGDPALVVLQPPTSGSRLAEVYACEGADPRSPVRTVVLPAQ